VRQPPIPITCLERILYFNGEVPPQTGFTCQGGAGDLTVGQALGFFIMTGELNRPN